MQRLIARTIALTAVLVVGYLTVTRLVYGDRDQRPAAEAAETPRALPSIESPRAPQLLPPAQLRNPTGTSQQSPPLAPSSAAASKQATDPFAQPHVGPRALSYLEDASTAQPATPPAGEPQPQIIVQDIRSARPADASQSPGSRIIQRLDPPPAATPPAAAVPSSPPAETPASSPAPVRPASPPATVATSRDHAALVPWPAAASTSESPAEMPSRLVGRRESIFDQMAAQAPSPSPVETSGGEGAGKPGVQQLEGPQTPQLVIEKIVPPEVQVGKPAAFQVKVKNVGPAIARNVEVRDEVPKGARLAGTQPPASRGARGELVWSLGNLEPGKDAVVEMQLIPVAEGELGSVASVVFAAEATARTMATRPQLVLKTTAPNQIALGEQVAISITISNPGTGIARNVVLEDHLPPGLKHPVGEQLENVIGDIKPGESRQFDLKLTAAQAGQVFNHLVARADGDLKVEDRLGIEVLAPQLDIALEGPKRRYLEREATYVVEVSNPGTAPARQVELVAHLPSGLKFVSANNAGQYHEATRSVHWLLEELPSKEAGAVELTTVPVQPGQQTIRVSGSADRGLQAEKEHPVVIDGIAAILFQVADSHDPIEVGGETTYEVKVVNQGSKAAGNVQLVVHLPPGLKAVAAEGPTRNSADGARVVFEPLRDLAPKAETLYRLRVQGVKAGDQRIRVQLQSDEFREPVTKEESTRVFADE